jgi:nitrogen fixation protein NifB
MDLLPDEAEYDPAKRVAYRDIVAQERGEHVLQKAAAAEIVAESEVDASVLVAVATKGGGRINQHFGHANEFQVYEVSPSGIAFIGHRKVDQYCQGGWGEDATLDGVLAVLEGVSVVLCAKIGDCPKESLSAAGITASDDYAYDWIEAGIAAWYAAAYPATARLTA